MHKRKIGLIIASIIQVFILVGMLVSANIPLYFGQEIKLKTNPVEPRSMFRGNYVRLDYPFEQYSIQSGHLLKSYEFRAGEKIYISLVLGEDGIYNHSDISLQPPSSGIYLQGRVDKEFFTILDRFNQSGVVPIKVANINAFFAPKEKALALEKELSSNGAIAVLMVSDKGKAILKSVIPKLPLP